MEHECKYFSRVEGKLICSACGKPSPRPDAFAKLITQPAENKVIEIEENKNTEPALVVVEPDEWRVIWPPEKKRGAKVIKKGIQKGRKRAA